MAFTPGFFDTAIVTAGALPELDALLAAAPGAEAHVLLGLVGRPHLGDVLPVDGALGDRDHDAADLVAVARTRPPVPDAARPAPTSRLRAYDVGRLERPGPTLADREAP